MTFLSKSQTVDLGHGDTVSLSGYDKKAEGKLFIVDKVITGVQCESHVMVTVHSGALRYTVDRHWLNLVTMSFDDDIPF